MPPVLIAALDIGGTKIAAAVVDPVGRLLDRARVATPAAAGGTAVIAAATDLVQTLCRSHNVVGLGVGTAGVVDPDTGIVLSATDALPGWAGTDVRGELSAALGLPVVVRNDAHAHALGEAAHGAGIGRTSLLHVAVGTGIGAAFYHSGLPGGLLIGAHAAAGHVGHLPSREADDLACSCGGKGHLEALAAGPSLVREYQRRGGVRATDLRKVAALAASGDQTAAAVIELGGRAAGSAIGGLINTFDPAVVVVGGGVTSLGDPWWAPLRDAAAQEVLPALAETPIVLSSLGEDAALLGAASLARHLVLGGIR